MPLSRDYPRDFERLWLIYPKWPQGRSKKEPAYKAYVSAKRLLEFVSTDLDVIEADILARKDACESWQRGNKFGPVAMQVYWNQHLWNEPYTKVKRRFARPEESAQEKDRRELDNSRKFWQSAHDRGQEVPEKFRHYLKEEDR